MLQQHIGQSYCAANTEKEPYCWELGASPNSGEDHVPHMSPLEMPLVIRLNESMMQGVSLVQSAVHHYLNSLRVVL